MLPQFINMYEKRQFSTVTWCQPIVGIGPCVISSDAFYFFGDQQHEFYMKAESGVRFGNAINEDNEDNEQLYDFTLEKIIEVLKSQLLPTDEFTFVINEGLVKAKLRIKEQLFFDWGNNEQEKT